MSAVDGGPVGVRIDRPAILGTSETLLLLEEYTSLSELPITVFLIGSCLADSPGQIVGNKDSFASADDGWSFYGDYNGWRCRFSSDGTTAEAYIPYTPGETFLLAATIDTDGVQVWDHLGNTDFGAASLDSPFSPSTFALFGYAGGTGMIPHAQVMAVGEIGREITESELADLSSWTLDEDERPSWLESSEVFFFDASDPIMQYAGNELGLILDSALYKVGMTVLRTDYNWPLELVNNYRLPLEVI